MVKGRSVCMAYCKLRYLRNIVLNGRYIVVNIVINGFKEKETFYFKKRRYLFSFFVSLFELGMI